MNRTLVVLLLVVCSAVPAAGKSEPDPLHVVFLDDGGTVAAEVRAGVEAAARYYHGIDRLRRRPVVVVRINAKLPREELAEAIKKAKPVCAIAAPRARDLDEVVRLARRIRKVPFLLATHWEPAFTLSPRDPVFHVGGNAVDQAIEAAGYCKYPLDATSVAAVHDGSGPSRALAEAFLRNRYAGTESGGLHLVPRTRDDVCDLLQKLGTKKVRALFVALDHDEALRVGQAAEELDRRKRWAEAERESAPVDRHKIGLTEKKGTTPGRPRLLFADGVITSETAKNTPLTARFLIGTNPYIEDGPSTFYRSIRKTNKVMPSPIGERGYAAVALAMDALSACRVRTRALVGALRELAYEEYAQSTMLTGWGQAKYFRWQLWKPTGIGALLIKPTYLPDKIGGLLLRQRLRSQLRWEPGTRLVHLTYGEPDEQTIDEDLKRIGLSTRGYEKRIDDWIKDEILVRTAARLNELFWRNQDGTAIPGVSYRITFVADIPKEYDDHHWGAKIAKDHPSAGGMAGDPYSQIFSTFIVRTMYLKYGLSPRVRREDLPFFTGQYRWGSDLDENIRNDEIRCLIEGLSGAFAMTTAHEIGHIAGCGHDTMSPRSIMNVRDGAGLEPDWSEWIPLHVRALETRIDREPADRRRAKR